PKSKPIPQTKAGEIQILIRVIDAWGRLADADIRCEITDNVSGVIGPLLTGIRQNAPVSSANTKGLLPPLPGITKGVLYLNIQMLSEDYEHLTSEAVDLQKGGIPYSFPAGTRFATFSARQGVQEKKVTVSTGESLANKVETALQG